MLTINLTNAVILALLKAVVIIAGIFGKFSFWTYPGKYSNVLLRITFDINFEMSLIVLLCDLGLGGIPFSPFARSFQVEDAKVVSELESSLLSQEDIRWASMYMWALNKNGDFSCLYRLACENRDTARVYVHAGNILDKAFQQIKW